MTNLNLEKLVADKMYELCDASIIFLENKFHKLSPAGKCNACLLTVALISNIIEPYTKPKSFNGLDMTSILLNFEVRFKLLFSKFRLEYEKIRKLEKLGVPSLDNYLKQGNDLLLKNIDDNKLIKDIIMVGISRLWAEFNRCEYENGGELLMPKGIFCSLYIYPFFFLSIPNNKNSQFFQTLELDLYKLDRVNPSIQEADFIFIPGYLSDYLKDLVQKDTTFLSKISNKNLNSSYQSTPSSSTNSSCYIATMAYRDIDHPQVEYLRTFRDERLLNYRIGELFVKYYYKYSPKLVERLRDYQLVNKVIRKGLDVLIAVLKKSLPR